MPFRSAKQRRYLHAKHPEIAQRWEREAQAKGTKAVQPAKARQKRKGR